MRLHELTPAPNPRRVRVFLAEKGVEIPSVQVDVFAGANRTPEFLKKNPSGKIPVLELDDGTCIAESIAICRYIEALHPEPNLFGRNPVEVAQIEMRNRQLEFELMGPVGVAWVNGPVLAQMAPGMFKQIPEALAAAEANVARFYQRIDGELASREFMGGDRYSVADITALCVTDFAAERVGVARDPGLANLARWHAAVAARPSAKA